MKKSMYKVSTIENGKTKISLFEDKDQADIFAQIMRDKLIITYSSNFTLETDIEEF
mgnify:CR=1 FL=1